MSCLVFSEASFVHMNNWLFKRMDNYFNHQFLITELLSITVIVVYHPIPNLLRGCCEETQVCNRTIVPLPVNLVGNPRSPKFHWLNTLRQTHVFRAPRAPGFAYKKSGPFPPQKDHAERIEHASRHIIVCGSRLMGTP